MDEADRKHDNDVYLKAVAPDSSGEGLPYAPENYPNQGDNWRWKAGNRVNANGSYRDRFLYPPQRLLHLLKEMPTRARGGGGFASKPAVKLFLESVVPGADVDAFFKSFTWRIPYKKQLKESSSISSPDNKSSQNSEQTTTNGICCKARNRMCSSLTPPVVVPLSPPMPCDICCSELGFCRECCCILCCKTVDNSFQGYSYVKCEALVGDYRCCHVAHIECAVRAYMAGTVGGSIGLDAEYYCRRCDAKTDLVSHVSRLLDTCKSSSMKSYDQLERLLNVGACVLHGSQKASAKLLLAQIHHALTKLKHGVPLEDLWKEDNDSSGSDHHEDDCYSLEQQSKGSGNGDESRCVEYLKLDKEVDKALEALRKSQELEYKAAEEGFRRQRDYLHELYQQLEYESCQLRKTRLSTKGADLMRAVSDRKDQIQVEFNKLSEMKQVAALGFARASRDILRTHFGIIEQQEEQKAAPQ